MEKQENITQQSIESQKTKKFVFQLYSDNVDLIEALSYQEKNDLINNLLYNYKNESMYNKNVNKKISQAKKSLIILLAILIGIPLVIYLTSVSLGLTKHSYYYMQKNFEKLF